MLNGDRKGRIVTSTATFLPTERPPWQLLVLCFSATLGLSQGAQSQSACSPTQITRDEARQLLEATPDALWVRRRGGKISLDEYRDSSSYPPEKFYLYEMFSDKPSTTLLDNGIVGYFAVSKATGRVSWVVDPDEPFRGHELKRLLTRVRAKHCIGRDLVRRADAVPQG